MLILELEPANPQRVVLHARSARALTAHRASAPPAVVAETQTRIEQPDLTEAALDPDVRRWMPVAVPMLAVLLCACIAAIWTLV